MRAHIALVGALVVLLSACPRALATSSSAEAVTQGTQYAIDHAGDADFQAGVANDVAGATSVAPRTVHRIIIDNTGGTMVQSIVAVSVAANNGNADAQRVHGVIDGLVNNKGLDGQTLSSQNAENVMRIVSGETAVGSGAQAGMATVQGIQEAVGDRADVIVAERRSLVDKFGSDSAMASARMNADLARRIWFKAFYLNQDMDQKDGYAGYKYRAVGGSLGYDHAFGPFTLGGAFTYSRGKFEQKGFNDDNKVDNYGVSLYANYYHSSGFFGSLYGGYNYGDNDSKTWVPGAGWLTGDNHTDSFWAGGNMGYEIRPTQSFSLIPTVGIYYSHAKSSSYMSRLNGGAFMNYGKVSNHGWALPAEVSAKYTMQLDDCSSLTFKATGGYTYNLTNKGAHGRFNYAGVTDVTTTITGMKPGRHGWNVGAGIKYRRNRFDVSVEYRYDGKTKYDGHRVVGAFGINF